MCIVPRPARKFHCCFVQRRGCVQEGAKLARENHVDLILAVGGGSVSDCCKVVSAQAQADFAFLDPTYSLSVPFKQVISGAFDTLSHAMETYFGKPDENNLSDDIDEAVMRSVIRNIRVLLTDKDNYEARSELAWASAMAENGILKIGKITDFQCHMIRCRSGRHPPGAVPSSAPGQHRTVRSLCTECLGHRPGRQERAEAGTGWCGSSGVLHQGDRPAHYLCRAGHPG